MTKAKTFLSHRCLKAKILSSRMALLLYNNAKILHCLIVFKWSLNVHRTGCSMRGSMLVCTCLEMCVKRTQGMGGAHVSTIQYRQIYIPDLFIAASLSWMRFRRFCVVEGWSGSSSSNRKQLLAKCLTCISKQAKSKASRTKKSKATSQLCK